MLSPSGFCSLMLGAGVLAGTFLTFGSEVSETSTRPGAVASADAELATVIGREDPAEPVVAWEEKCCAQGSRCTPNFPPVLPAYANCWEKQAYSPNGIFRAGCDGQWSCTVEVGPRTINQNCVAPPAGSIIVPRCALEGINCVDYKTGSCGPTWGLYCVCDADGAPVQQAPGAWRCKQGSNSCAGIVPAAAGTE